MASVWPDPDLSVVLLLGLAGPLLGMASWTNRARLGIGIAALLMLWSVTAFAFKQPIHAWALPAAVASAYLLALAVRRHRDSLARAAASRRAQSALFLFAGPLFICVWATHLDSLTPVMELPPDDASQPASVSEPIPTSRSALTDRGLSIRLYTHSSLAKVEEAQSENAAMRLHQAALILVAEPDAICNCHGWIFTNGQYWIQSNDVDMILTDNGYRKTVSPRAGDLIIYRDGDDRVTHSGLVRLVNDGLILVESKWGQSGRYLHRPADQSYSTNWHFYHSSRPGHWLHLADEDPAGANIEE